jgi:hypothetical protein
LHAFQKNKEQNVWIRKKIVFIDRKRLHGFEGILGSAISFDNINIRQAVSAKHHRKRRTRPNGTELIIRELGLHDQVLKESSFFCLSQFADI